MSGLVQTKIQIDLPDNQGWTVARTQINFKVGYSSLIKNLPSDARLNPSHPNFKVETIYITIDKTHKHELTEEFHSEFIEKYLYYQAIVPSISLHIIAQKAEDETIRRKPEIQGRRAATPNKRGRIPKNSNASAASDSFSASAPLPTLTPLTHTQNDASMPPPPPCTTPSATTSATPVPAPATSFHKVSVIKSTASTKHSISKKAALRDEQRKRDARVERSLNKTFIEVPDVEGADQNAIKLSTGKTDANFTDESDQEEEEAECEVEKEIEQGIAVEEQTVVSTTQEQQLEVSASSTTQPLSIDVASDTVVQASTPPKSASTLLEAATPISVAPVNSAAVPTPSTAATPGGKTPGRSVSRNRTGHRSSLFSPTKCMVAHRVGGDHDQFQGGRTYAEQEARMFGSFHNTTGSLHLSQATRTPLKLPHNTPAKRSSVVGNTPATGVHVTEEEAAFAKQMASASKNKRNPDGRPSIGTIENQWEYMRSTYFNNDDEEIQWSMVSRNKGAYKYAHLKNERAEDRYFKSLSDIAAAEAKIESATSGSAAKLMKVLQDLETLRPQYISLPNSVELNANTTDIMKKIKDLVENENALHALSASCRKDVESLLRDEATYHQLVQAGKDGRTIRGQMVRNVARLMIGDEVANAKRDLSKAQRISDEAVEYMEKWSRREKDAIDYHEIMRQQEQEWLEDNHIPNMRALLEMRSFIPVNVSELSVPDFMALVRANNGLFSLELATEIKQNKLLHWIVTHTDDIAYDSFLTGDKKAIFENFEVLDLIELRALAVVIPVKFENDKDGKKAEWRSRFFTRVRQMASQESGELVKGGYDPVAGCRVMVAQKPLKPEQLRRPVYYFITKEKSVLKVKQYNDRLAMLARREAALAQAEATAIQAKNEYDIVLAEMRDPAFIEEYGLDKLTEAKEQAKAMRTSSDSALKSARLDLKNLQNTINNMPVSREQYLQMETELHNFLSNFNITWTEKGLSPCMIAGVFDSSPEIKKIERAAAKFVSAEEEAAQRKFEMEQIINRKPAFSSETSVETTIETERTVDLEPSASAVEDVATEQNGTNSSVPAPCTEPRRLSVAALGIFSPSANRYRDSVCPVTPAGEGNDYTTPRKRNSVLANANPDMLNTLNKMLMSSPAATPLRMGRASMFSAPSAAKLALTTNQTKDDTAGDAKKPEVKVTTRSQILMKLINPSSSAVSPKRNPLGAVLGGGPPKLGFLAQLTARVGKKASNGADAGVGVSGDENNTTTAPSSSISSTARSLFADIARFRKPDPEETSVAATGTLEDKENASQSNLPTAVPNATKLNGLVPARPALSLFDEIRKRRVID